MDREFWISFVIFQSALMRQFLISSSKIQNLLQVISDLKFYVVGMLITFLYFSPSVSPYCRVLFITKILLYLQLFVDFFPHLVCLIEIVAYSRVLEFLINKRK